jgi:protein ImuB
VLQAVNGPARKLGLRPGQSMTAAQALSKGFATAEYDVADIEHWQQFLAAWAYRFSARSACITRGRWCSRSNRAWACSVLVAVRGAFAQANSTELGFRHRIVAAPNPVAARCWPTPMTAWWCLTIKPCSITWGSCPSTASVWNQCRHGVVAHGPAHPESGAGLPRHSLARRFEAQVLKHLDTLFGRGDWRWRSTCRRIVSTCVSNSISTCNPIRPCCFHCAG